MAPSKEDFDLWRDNPVTRFIMDGLLGRVEDQRLQWLDLSWSGGSANQTILNELRTRSSAWVELVDNDYEQWCSILGVDPRDE